MDQSHSLRERAQTIEREIEAIEEKRQRIALAFAGGNMDIGVYRATDDILLTDLDRMRTDLAGVKRQLALMPDVQSRRESLEALTRILDQIHELSPLEVNALLRNAGIRIECEERSIVYIGIQ